MAEDHSKQKSYGTTSGHGTSSHGTHAHGAHTNGTDQEPLSVTKDEPTSQENTPAAAEQTSQQLLNKEPVPGVSGQKPMGQTVPATSSSVFLIELPPDYITMSWLSCTFCCCPLSSLAVMYSYKSRESAASGDFEKAKYEGNLAKKLALSASVIGFVILTAIAIYMWTR